MFNKALGSKAKHYETVTRFWALKQLLFQERELDRAKMTIVRYDKMVIYKLTGFYHVCNNMPYNEKMAKLHFFLFVSFSSLDKASYQ